MACVNVDIAIAARQPHGFRADRLPICISFNG